MALIYNKKKKVYYIVFVLKTISFFGELKKNVSGKNINQESQGKLFWKHDFLKEKKLK